MGKISFVGQSKCKRLADFDGEISKETGEDLTIVESSTLQESDVDGGAKFDQAHVYTKQETAAFNKEKAKLHEYYKKLKVGMIEWSDVPFHYKGLLEKYYGLEGDKNGKKEK